MTEENQEFKAKTISSENESLTLTLPIAEITESIKGRKIEWFVQTFTFTITDKRRCLKLEKSSYPFYRTDRKTKKTSQFFGYKIFHHRDIGNDTMCQEIDCNADEDCQHALGISIIRSEVKEVTKERLAEILKHAESNWSFYEGRLSQGSTKVVE